MYLGIIASMYDPEVIGAMDAYLELLPQEIVRGMNFNMIEPNLTGFLAGYFYGFPDPAVSTDLLGYYGKPRRRQLRRFGLDGLPALHAQSTLEDCPDPGVLSIWAASKLLILLTALMGVLFSEVLFPGELDIWRFVLLNIGTILLYYALSSIGFFASCLFNETSRSLALGAGLPVLFLLMKLISDVGDELSFIGRASLFSLFDPASILARDNSVLPSFLALFAIGTVLYAAGIIVFRKKDLPL
jgi:ABC-2 type transport system permease protein